MKINDIVIEAVNPSTGTPQGNPTPGNTDPRISRAIKTWVDEWKSEVQANPTAAQDPNALQQYAIQLARDKNGKQLFTPNPPIGMAPAQVEQYIGAVVEKTLTLTSAPVKQAQSDSQAKETKQIINTLISQAEQSNDRIGYADINKVLTASGAITANMEPLERRQAITNIAELLKQHGIEITQGPHGTAPGVGPQLSRGISIISSDPLVLQYDKRKYALNRSNQWVLFGSTKTASPEMSTFLNKQLQAI